MNLQTSLKLKSKGKKNTGQKGNVRKPLRWDYHITWFGMVSRKVISYYSSADCRLMYLSFITRLSDLYCKKTTTKNNWMSTCQTQRRQRYPLLVRKSWIPKSRKWQSQQQHWWHCSSDTSRNSPWKKNKEAHHTVKLLQSCNVFCY